MDVICTESSSSSSSSSSSQGGWKHGLRHGIGVLKYEDHVKGQWRGLWWAGKQHGVQLWCRLNDQGEEVEATPYLFKHDIKVCMVDRALG